MQTFKFEFEVTCSNPVNPDVAKVEDMIDLAMQDLVYDDNFIAALGERESVTIRVVPILDKPKQNIG